VCANINGAGQGIEDRQRTDLEKLLERMSQKEQDAYARHGSLPEWLLRAIGASPTDSEAGEEKSRTTESKKVQ
jgi:hypothetical protein